MIKSAAATIRDGEYFISNSEFRNCHTLDYGGVIYSLNNYKLEVYNIISYNSTSLKTVIIYINYINIYMAI